MTRVFASLEKDTYSYEDDEIATSAGYNASCIGDETIKPKTVIRVLPLFSDKAATLAMMKHAMQLTMEDTQFLSKAKPCTWL